MNHRFLIVGIILLLMGIQFRAVDSFVLTQKATTFIHERARNSGFQTANPYDFDSLLLTAGPVSKKKITPPRWAGWALISVGAVLTLHGLTLSNE